MQLPESTGIGKSRTIAGVEIAFYRKAFGKQNVMPVELDVPVLHLINPDLGDRAAIDQVLDRNEDAVNENTMIGGEPDVP